MTVVTVPAMTGVIVNPLVTGTDASLGQVAVRDVTVTALSTPATPTITPAGTTGASTWTYKVVAKVGSGGTARVTAASTGGSTTTGNATLTSDNYNVITWTAVTGATSYDIYRTAHGTAPTTNGLIGNVLATAPLSFNDTGVAGDSSTAPTVNTTGIVTAVGFTANGGNNGVVRVLGNYSADVASSILMAMDSVGGSTGRTVIEGADGSTRGAYALILVRGDGSSPLTPFSVSSAGVPKMANLPTSVSGLTAGELWNNLGIMSVA